MLEGLSNLISLDRSAAELLRDFIDILIVAFIVYRALLVLKGTRAMQMGIGVVAFGGLYGLAKYAQLATLISVLSWVASSAILIVVVIFQSDIRRALIRVGSKAWLTRGPDAQERVLDEVVAAATELARHRMGAIIALERDADVGEFVQSKGIDLDSLVTRELLVSLFIPESVNKTHDGAVLIRNHRIQRAGVFFQMPEEARIEDPTLGSRHRAAIGITERTDALVVVVSEERGTITLFFNTNSVLNLTADNLRAALSGLFGRATADPGWFARMTSMLGRRAADDASPPSTDSPDPRPSKTDKADKSVGASKSTVKAGPSKAISASKSIAASKSISASKSIAKDPAVKRASQPPSTDKPTRASSSSGIKPSKQSGSFRAMKSSSDAKVEEKTPAALRVSVPMPTGKDKEREADSGAEPTEEESPKAPPTVSKPMTPTELPSSTLRSGDDT
ncbi:MAG: diadenylate cyclase [Polyangiaceae bacterium]